MLRMNAAMSRKIVAFIRGRHLMILLLVPVAFVRGQRLFKGGVYSNNYVNNRGPQLLYDWLLQNHPWKPLGVASKNKKIWNRVDWGQYGRWKLWVMSSSMLFVYTPETYLHLFQVFLSQSCHTQLVSRTIL